MSNPNSSLKPRLLVVLAPPRCYTTLVSAMIGQHPETYGLPETHLFTSQSMSEWWDSHQRSDRTDGLSRAVAQIIFDGQTNEAVQLAREWLRRPNVSTASIINELASRVAPLMLVEKTPQTSERMEHLRRMNAQFPAACFLHLLRHPLGHVMSRLERRLKHFSATDPAMGLVQVAQRFGGADPQMLWYRYNSNIVSFLDEVSPERQLRLRAEDLLSEPDKHLCEITKWLGLRSDPEAIDAMKHPERSPYACFGPSNARMGGDENFFSRPTFNPVPQAAQCLDEPVPWRQDGKGFRPVIRDLARRFGYN